MNPLNNFESERNRENGIIDRDMVESKIDRK